MFLPTAGLVPALLLGGFVSWVRLRVRLAHAVPRLTEAARSPPARLKEAYRFPDPWVGAD